MPEQRVGITVHMRVDRQTSTVDFPEATQARPDSDGTLTLLQRETHPDRNLLGPRVLGQIAKGCWTRWSWTDEGLDAQDLDAVQ
jgi:hypothetical protein